MIKIAPVDLHVFDFDWDLTWAAFFLNAEGTIYGRFGGRDGKDADNRNSLEGLRFALLAALERHRRGPAVDDAAPPPRPPLLIERLPVVKNRRSGCIHCHEVKELLRQQAVADGNWDPSTRWVFPLPENVGLTLDRNRGNLVASVSKGSVAERVGLLPGDVLDRLNGRTVFSFADAQYALHRAPTQGSIPVTWLHEGQARSGELPLAPGWRKTNLTWRPSLLDLLPSLTVYGDDLTATEKKSLGLEESQLAFRQDQKVHSRAREAGIQPGDVILGVEGQKLQTDVDGFLSHVRQNYLIGDRIVLEVLREGKRVSVPMVLK